MQDLKYVTVMYSTQTKMMPEFFFLRSLSQLTSLKFYLTVKLTPTWVQL